MRQDLFTLRQIISQYTLDKHESPRSLDDLARVGYLKSRPANLFPDRPDVMFEKDPEMCDPPIPRIPSNVDVPHASC